MPKNIPVSAYENFSNPYDFGIFIAVGFSLISIMVLWRFFKKIQNENDVTFVDVFFAMIKTLIGEFFLIFFCVVKVFNLKF